MSLLSKKILIASLTLFCLPVLAKERHILKGAQITVDQYDAKAKVFLITINAESAVGPNYATPENLVKALGTEKPVKKFMESLDQVIGNEFALKSDLPLISEADIMKRMKNGPKSPKKSSTIPGAHKED